MAHNPEERTPDAGLPDGLGEVEAVLASFAVRPAQLSAARLMYLAGQQSVSRPGRGLWAARIWPAATAALTLAVLVLCVVLATRPGPQVVERIVYVPQEEFVANPDDTPPTQMVFQRGTPEALAKVPTPVYLRQREMAVAKGVDSLSPLRTAGGLSIRPATYREMQKDVVDGEFGGRRKPMDANYYSWPSLMPSLMLRGDSL